jgi:general secretion pathway protein C
MENFKYLFTAGVVASIFGIVTTSSLSYFLPVRGVSKSVDKPFHQYESYRSIGQLFIVDKKPEKKAPPPKKEEPKPEKVYDMKKWKLLATYISSYTAFATILDGKDVETVELDYVYKGYELIDLKDDEAIFLMSGKHYSLKLVEEGKKRKDDKKESEAEKSIEESEEFDEREKEVEVEVNTEPGSDEVSSATLQKKDVQFYLKNPGQIWKSIKFRDYRVDRRLRGFRVVFVKQGSAFDQLGLKTGDIITAINGEEITSYSQVQKYYKNISKIRNLNLRILRNGEEKEIDYEIE